VQRSTGQSLPPYHSAERRELDSTELSQQTEGKKYHDAHQRQLHEKQESRSYPHRKQRTAEHPPDWRDAWQTRNTASTVARATAVALRVVTSAAPGGPRGGISRR
jgi:hypothetical protein